jgi:hypothetical protein
VVAVVAVHGMQKEEQAEQVEAVMAEASMTLLVAVEAAAPVFQVREQESRALQIPVAVAVDLVGQEEMILEEPVVQELLSLRIEQLRLQLTLQFR